MMQPACRGQRHHEIYAAEARCSTAQTSVQPLMSPNQTLCLKLCMLRNAHAPRTSRVIAAVLRPQNSHSRNRKQLRHGVLGGFP